MGPSLPLSLLRVGGWSRPSPSAPAAGDASAVGQPCPLRVFSSVGSPPPARRWPHPSCDCDVPPRITNGPPGRSSPWSSSPFRGLAMPVISTHVTIRNWFTLSAPIPPKLSIPLLTPRGHPTADGCQVTVPRTERAFSPRTRVSALPGDAPPRHGAPAAPPLLRQDLQPPEPVSGPAQSLQFPSCFLTLPARSLPAPTPPTQPRISLKCTPISSSFPASICLHAARADVPTPRRYLRIAMHVGVVMTKFKPQSSSTRPCRSLVPTASHDGHPGPNISALAIHLLTGEQAAISASAPRLCPGGGFRLSHRLVMRSLHASLFPSSRPQDSADLGNFPNPPDAGKGSPATPAVRCPSH